MPKILIRDEDRSTTGNTLVSNFRVLVAGKIDSTNSKIDTSVFDANGVYLCTSVSDFTTHIGKYEDKEGIFAIGPTLEKVDGENNYISFNDKADFYKFYYYTYPGQVYTQTGTEALGDDGYLKKDGYTYTLAEVDEYSSTTKYYVILKGNEGRDASDEVVSFGNKMAYNLLQLGYQVYYKKINSINEINGDKFWEFAEDKSIYDFRYITHGLTKATAAANEKIAEVAIYRKDCTALLEIDEARYAGKTQTEAITDIIEYGITSAGDKYSAYFAPYVEYNLYDEDDDKNIYSNKFPACFHYLACAAYSRQSYREWYAVGGYTRGTSNYVIKNVGCIFGDSATAKLQPRKKAESGGPAKAVNLIVTLPQGHFIWGNRTAERLVDDLKFSHFLNIRQLCTTLVKQVYTTCRALTYDPNSDTLWTNFCGSLRPLLERMKSDQGIKEYAFERKTTEMKGKLFAAIRIVPIEAVEDFEIVATLEDNLDQPNIVIDEELLSY